MSKVVQLRGGVGIEVPDDATQGEIDAIVQEHASSGLPGDQYETNEDGTRSLIVDVVGGQKAAEETAKPSTISGLSEDEIRAKFEKVPESARPGLTDLAANGMFAGLQNDVSGGVSAFGSLLAHPIKALESGGASIADAYHAGRTDAMARIDYAKMMHPNLAIPTEIMGALVNPIGAEAKGLLGAAKVGAGYGAVAGFENNNGDLTDRALSASEGALTGAVVAPAIGGALRVPGAVVGGIKTVLEGSPALAQRIIGKAIRNDGNTAAGVGEEMARAAKNNVPMMLADTGDNARGLLAASTRSPGPTRTIARTALEDRQAALPERMLTAIERDLGPIDNLRDVSDQLMTRARDDAAPLYEKAYSLPGAQNFGERLAPLFDRPSMGKAFAKARRIAAEEGRDPATLGFELNSSGETTLTKVPSWQTLDYVKRGLDDVIEGYRDKTTGKLHLDTEGRAINSTLRSFLGAFDKANPIYAKARQAWGGPSAAIDAMDAGRSVFRLSADDLEARLRDLTPWQKEMFALGARSEMSNMITGKGDSSNFVSAITGTGKKRAMLSRVFGDRPGFNRFVQTLQQEKEGFNTFGRGLTGSVTALNQGDDAMLKGLTAGVDAVASGGLPVASTISTFIKHGASMLSEKTRQQVAALLSETDPAAFRELALKLRAQAASRAAGQATRGRIAAAAGKGTVTASQ